MKTLVVTDVQRDFFSPEGSLYVAGGETLPAKIAAVAAEYDRIVFTLDWHPADHCSFKAQGGIWPEHCVQYTQGAGLADEFTPLLKLGPEKVALYFKGWKKDEEQYGAFGDLTHDDTIVKWFKASDVIEICGIAGDYCVKETAALALAKTESPEKIILRSDLIASIDDGSTLASFVKENNLKLR